MSFPPLRRLFMTAVIGSSATLASLVLPAAAGRAGTLSGVGGCPMFPADNVWHADASRLPVSPKSQTYVNSIGAGGQLHPDFGSGLWNGGPIGIPYDLVPGSQPFVPVTFTYQSESDPGPYPIPPNASIEGGPNSSGDRHVLVVDTGTCNDYEMWNARPHNHGAYWTAGSGARFNLRGNTLRKDGNTSADAAGLPILSGLVRYDEVAAGLIDHAIRITVGASDASYLWPARHQAGTNNPALPPMGLRLRLKASVDISGYPAMDRVILQAMKTYGVIVADNGTSWYISGVPDPRWNNSDLHKLNGITGSDFEALDEKCLMESVNSAIADPTDCP